MSKEQYSDMWALGNAYAAAAWALCAGQLRGVTDDTDIRFEDNGLALCIAQQIVAELWGLA